MDVQCPGFNARVLCVLMLCVQVCSDYAEQLSMLLQCLSNSLLRLVGKSASCTLLMSLSLQHYIAHDRYASTVACMAVRLIGVVVSLCSVSLSMKSFWEASQGVACCVCVCV